MSINLHAVAIQLTLPRFLPKLNHKKRNMKRITIEPYYSDTTANLQLIIIEYTCFTIFCYITVSGCVYLSHCVKLLVYVQFLCTYLSIMYCICTCAYYNVHVVNNPGRFFVVSLTNNRSARDPRWLVSFCIMYQSVSCIIQYHVSHSAALYY